MAVGPAYAGNGGADGARAALFFAGMSAHPDKLTAGTVEPLPRASHYHKIEGLDGGGEYDVRVIAVNEVGGASHRAAGSVPAGHGRRPGADPGPQAPSEQQGIRLELPAAQGGRRRAATRSAGNEASSFGSW